MIEAHEGGGFTVTGPHIGLFQLVVMRQGLELELKGLKKSRGRSVNAIVRERFGFRGNRQKVLAQLLAHIENWEEGDA